VGAGRWVQLVGAWFDVCTRLLCAKSGPNVLFCMPNRTMYVCPIRFRCAHSWLGAATWRCWSGRVPMGVTGTLKHAQVQWRAATWWCCSGHVHIEAEEIGHLEVLRWASANGHGFT
jgi:hypothetical protein